MGLRLATSADIESMHRVRLAVHENRLLDPARIQPEDYRPMLDTQGRGWVYEIDRQVAGFGIADHAKRNIWALFVAPGMERRGIGRFLLDAMVEWLHGIAPEPIWLTTEPNTRAERFYLAAGWRRVCVEANGEIRFERRTDRKEGSMQDKPRILAIYTSATAGKPMRALAEATLEPGRGVVGDRYDAGIGTFSQKLKGRPDAEVTLIEKEEIDRFNRAESLATGDGDFRRNIVTSGVRLNDLVGVTFAVGSARLEGIRLCEPCALLAQRVSPKVLPGLVHRAGLRARVIAGGIVRPGDTVGVRAAASD